MTIIIDKNIANKKIILTAILETLINIQNHPKTFEQNLKRFESLLGEPINRRTLRELEAANLFWHEIKTNLQKPLLEAVIVSLDQWIKGKDKDENFFLIYNHREELKKLFETSIKAAAQNLPWSDFNEKAILFTDQFDVLSDQLIRELQNKLIEQVSNNNKIEVLKSNLSKLHDSLTKTEKENQKKRTEFEHLVATEKQHYQALVEKQFGKKELSAALAEIDQLDQKDYAVIADNIALIKDEKQKSLLISTIKPYCVSKDVKVFSEIADNINNSNSVKLHGMIPSPKDWEELHLQLIYFKPSTEAQAALKKHLLDCFIEIHNLSTAQSIWQTIWHPKKETMEEARRHFEYTISALYLAKSKQQDEGILFGQDKKSKLKGADLLVKEGTPYSKNLTHDLDVFIKKIKNNELLFAKSAMDSLVISSAYEKESSNPTELTADEHYQLYWKYRQKTLHNHTLLGEQSIFNDISKECQNLVWAAFKGSQAAQDKLQEKNKVFQVHQVESIIEDEFMNRLKQYEPSSLEYKAAQRHLFFLYYNRYQSHYYDDTHERIHDLYCAFRALMNAGNETQVKQVQEVLIAKETSDEALFKRAEAVFYMEMSGAIHPEFINHCRMVALEEIKTLKDDGLIKNINQHNQQSVALVNCDINKTGQYVLHITPEQLGFSKPICFVDPKTGEEIARLYESAGQIHVHGYGSTLKIKIDETKNNQWIFENPQGEINLKANIKTENPCNIFATTKHLKIRGGIVANSINLFNSGKITLSSNVDMHALDNVFVKSNSLELNGKLLAKGSLTANLDSGLVIGERATCVANQTLQINANNNIYLKGQALLKANTLGVQAASLMTNGNANIQAENGDLKLNDQLIVENQSALDITHASISANKIKNYNEIHCADAQIHISDKLMNSASGKIKTDECLQISGENVFNEGKIDFGKNLQVQINKVFVHGASELTQLSNFVKNKVESSGSRISGENASIVAGAYVNAFSLMDVRDLALTSLAEFNFGVTATVSSKKLRLLALNANVDVPNVIKMKQDMIEFLLQVKNGNMKDALKSLASMETVWKGASSLRWILQTFIPQLGQPISVTWSALLAIINTPKLFKEAMALHDQKDKVEPYQIYNLVAQVNGAITQGLSIGTQMVGLKQNGISSLKRPAILPTIASNLSAMVMPSTDNQALAAAQLGGVSLGGQIDNRNMFSYSKGHINAALTLSDNFFAARDENTFNISKNRSIAGNSYTHSGIDIADQQFINVNNMIESGRMQAHQSTWQGDNLSLDKNSRVYANNLSMQNKNMEALGNIVAKNANILTENKATLDGSIQVSNGRFQAKQLNVEGKIFVQGKPAEDTSLQLVADNLVRTDKSVVNAHNATVIEVAKNAELGGRINASKEIADVKGHLTLNEKAKLNSGQFRADNIENKSAIHLNHKKATNTDKEAAPDLVLYATHQLNSSKESRIDGKNSHVVLASEHNANIDGNVKAGKLDVSVKNNLKLDIDGHIDEGGVYAKKMQDNSKITVKGKKLEASEDNKEIKPDFVVQVEQYKSSNERVLNAKNRTVLFDTHNAKITGHTTAGNLYIQNKEKLVLDGETNVHHGVVQSKDVDINGKIKVDEENAKVNDHETEKKPELIIAAENQLNTSEDSEIDGKDSTVVLQSEHDANLLGKADIKKLHVNVDNELHLGIKGNIEIGTVHAKKIQDDSDITIDGDKVEAAKEDDKVDPDFIIQAEDYNSSDQRILNAKGKTVVLDTENAVVNGKTIANELYVKNKENLTINGQNNVNHGVIQSHQLNLNGKITVDAKNEDATKADLTLVADNLIKGKDSEIDAKDAVVAASVKEGSLEGSIKARKEIIHADESLKLNENAEVNDAYYDAKHTEFNGKIKVLNNCAPENEEEAKPNVVFHSETMDSSEDSSIEGEDATTVFDVKDGAINTNMHVKNEIVNAEGQVDVGGELKNHYTYLKGKGINYNGHANVEKDDVFEEDSDRFTMGENANIRGDGTFITKAKELKLTKLDIAHAHIETPHLNLNDLLASQNEFKDVHIRDSLHAAVEDNVTFDKRLSLSYALSLSAPNIDVEKNLHSDKGLSLQATKGNIHVGECGVHSSGNVILDAENGKVINDKGRVTAEEELYVHAKDDVINTAGTLGSKHFTNITSDTGNVVNQCEEEDDRDSLKNIKDKSAIRPGDYKKKYKKGNIFGGDGEGHDNFGLYVHAGGKVINDTSVMESEGNNFVQGTKGVESFGRANNYLSYAKKWDSWNGGEKHTVEHSTQVESANIISKNGKNIVQSDEGTVESKSTDFLAQKGTEIYGKEGVHLTGYVGNTKCTKDVNDYFGLVTEHKKEKSEYACPTVVLDPENVKIISEKNIVADNTAIFTRGKAGLYGENVSFTSPTLNYAIDDTSRYFNMSYPNQTSLPGNAVYQDIKNLANSNNGWEKAANTWNTTLDSMLTANGAFDAARSRSVIPLFNPSAGFNYNIQHQKSSGQSVAANTGLQCGELDIIAKEKVTLGSDIDVAGDAHIKAKELLQQGTQLNNKNSFNKTSLGGSVSLSGDVSGNIGLDSSDYQSKLYQNQMLKIGGKLNLDVDDWILENADTYVDQIEGRVKNLTIQSDLSESQSKNKSLNAGLTVNPANLGAPPTGSFAASQGSSDEKWINQRSGLHVAKGINEPGGPHFEVTEKTKLVAGDIISEGVNNFKSKKIESETLKEHHNQTSEGFSANFTDITKAPLPNSGTLQGSYNRNSTEALSTIYGAEGTNVDAEDVTGELNTTSPDGTRVIEDTHINGELRIPLKPKETFDAFNENMHALKEGVSEYLSKKPVGGADEAKPQPPEAPLDKKVSNLGDVVKEALDTSIPQIEPETTPEYANDDILTPVAEPALEKLDGNTYGPTNTASRVINEQFEKERLVDNPSEVDHYQVSAPVFDRGNEAPKIPVFNEACKALAVDLPPVVGPEATLPSANPALDTTLQLSEAERDVIDQAEEVANLDLDDPSLKLYDVNRGNAREDKVRDSTDFILDILSDACQNSVCKFVVDPVKDLRRDTRTLVYDDDEANRAAAKNDLLLNAGLLIGGVIAAKAASALAPSISRLGLFGRVVPTTKELVEQLANSTGQEFTALSSKGYKLEIPHGNRRIVIRLMDEGGGRNNYYRISIDGKQSFTKLGEVSSDRSLTHINIEPTSHEDLMKIIERISNEHTPRNKL